MIFLVLSTGISLAGEIEFVFNNSYDGSEQLSTAYIPHSCLDTVDNPLLVVAHYMGGNRFTAKRTGYYEEADKRGWLVVCPELHGKRTSGATSCAAMEAQHDIIDSIEYMRSKFDIDESRIYIVGRSMGGQLSQVMAAKYPDLFAAAVSGQGISDLILWSETSTRRLNGNLTKECGELNDETRFDYLRRSSVTFASNLAYTPLMLWHGTNDTWVPPTQSERIVEEVRKHYRFQEDPHWLMQSAHCPQNYTASWICDKLTHYQNVCENGEGTPTRFFKELNIVTDEAKRYYWLDITPDGEKTFARVKASLRNDTLSIKSKQASKVTIDLAHVSKLVKFSKFEVKSDRAVDISIVKNGKTLFKKNVKKKSSGDLPDGLF